MSIVRPLLPILAVLLVAACGHHPGSHRAAAAYMLAPAASAEPVLPTPTPEPAQTLAAQPDPPAPTPSSSVSVKPTPIISAPISPPAGHSYPHTAGFPRLRITVPDAPVYMGCTSPTMSWNDLDCSHASVNQVVHLGDVMDYERIITDVHGVRYWVAGPWTPFGFIPLPDAQLVG